jgi:ATPase subunit of ABC transporter with duplicated ATPase domains
MSNEAHIGPNTHTLSVEQVPPGREQVISDVDKTVRQGTNVAIQGPMKTGKTTLLRHAACADVGGKPGVYTSLEGVNSLDSYKQEIDRARSQKKIEAGTPIAVAIDELGLLTLFPQAEKEAVIDFMNDSHAKGEITWLAACHTPLAEIDPKLEPLFPTQLTVDQP